VLITLKAGAHLGEMAMIDNAPRSATIRAKSERNLLVMRREECFWLIRSEPVIATTVELRAGALHPNPTARDQRSAAGARKELGEAEQFVIFIDRRGRCGVIAR
jgi:PPM family protein phosphatase